MLVKPAPATSNVETTRLGSAIDAYISNPGAAQAATVDKAFAELDGEIAELNERLATDSGEDRSEAKSKADNLRVYRDKEHARYMGAQARVKTNAVKEEVKDFGDKVEAGARKAGDAVRDAGQAIDKKLP